MLRLEQIDFTKSKKSWESLWQNQEIQYPFLTWEWQKAWWEVFGKNRVSLSLFLLTEGEEIVGMAPLVIQNEVIEWCGGTEVSDYLDLVSRQENKKDIWQIILKELSTKAKNIIFHNIPEDSASIPALESLGRELGYDVTREQEDVVPFIALPKSFDEYLALLSRKDRHELRRKMRRMEEVTDGNWKLKPTNKDRLKADLDNFFRLFRMRGADKDQFMTPIMEEFFRKECQAMFDLGILDLSTLCTANECISVTIGFIHQGRYYLYNSAFDPKFESASGGLMHKTLLIKKSIEEGLFTFDFMQGRESYKYHLGAKDARVYNITLLRQANRGQASI